METEEFRTALDDLMEWAGEAPTAVMCAEALPFRCHRRLLADALLVHGFEVVHILAPGRAEHHELPVFARIEGDRLVYDGDTLRF